MKKMNEKLLAGVLAVSALAGSMVTSVAQADTSAAVGASNMYYWRGLDLGMGDAAVWGDLKASSDAGVYGGIWMSSGDALFGTEYDAYIGYGVKAGDLGIDISYWSYNYPTLEVAPGDFAEIVLALSYGPVAFTYFDNAAISEDHFGPGADFGSEDYSYYTLAYTHDAISVKYGEHEDADGADLNGYSHVDLTYAFNSKVSFTLGNPLDGGDGGLNEEMKFVVNLSLPIE
jgi:uncharacterized protein (TIGR02001 family)